jgi:hypothetical protein
MLGEESLVAGDDDFPAADGFEDEFARFLDAAHQFDHDLDCRIIEQIAPTFGEQAGRDQHGSFLGRIFHCDLPDDEIAPDPFTEKHPVFFQIEENSGADRSKSGQTYAYFAHGCWRDILPLRGALGNDLLALPFPAEAVIQPAALPRQRHVNQPN